MAGVKLKLLDRAGSLVGEVEVDNFYTPPDAILVDKDVYVSTVPDEKARLKIPRDQLEYKLLGNVVRGMIVS